PAAGRAPRSGRRRRGSRRSSFDRFGEQRRHVDDPQLLAARAHAVVEHHRAERARDGKRLRAGLRRLAHTFLVDWRAALLHPHVRAPGAAAEGALAALLHLHRLADRRDELARLGGDVVVPREVAAVVVGDLGLALRRLELPVTQQLREQLGVVHHLVAPTEVGVLVRERVEAVRAARDDLRHAGVVQRRDVLLGVGLEHILVPHAPGRIAGAGLALAEDREVDARLLQQLDGGLRGGARTLVESGRAPDPVEDLGRRLAFGDDAHTEPFRPRGAIALRLAPRVADTLDVAQHRLRLLREARLHHHEVAAQVDDVVDVLDRDRALVHARAAGHAVPDHLLGDAVAGDLGEVAAGEQVRALGEQLIAHAHDHELRREQLPRRVRRADVLATAALGAREGVHHLLPREIANRAGAEADLGIGQVEAQR